MRFPVCLDLLSLYAGLMRLLQCLRVIPRLSCSLWFNEAVLHCALEPLFLLGQNDRDDLKRAG